MPLTREQALLAASVLALAFESAAAAAPPGGTIAQGAAAAAGAAKAAGPTKSGHGAPKKVATAPGSAKYHAPIGALIIPHGHAPSPGAAAEKAQDAAQAAKDKTEEAQYAKEHAAGLAEKAQDAAQAVAQGTHHWVQAGEHTYAVHNSLETHVPKDTDLSNPAAVKNAPKVVVKHGPQPEHVKLHSDTGMGPAFPHHEANVKGLAQDWKKLPDQPPKKSVQVSGKHAAWVPHDWQVHKAADEDATKQSGKYAKAPDGSWHIISKSGQVSDVPAHNGESMENWAASGGLLLEEHHPGPEPGHVAPNQAEPGAEPAKADVGGVAVTKEELHDAIAKLQGSPSTQIKGLLKGHPLAASDYHAAFKAELEAHPELKVPSGTKKQHASPAKLAFIHHLAGKLDKLTQDEAQAAAAKEAKEKAEAAAVHAQQLTPGTYEVGGVHVTAQEIQQAIAKLEGSKSTQIKGLLKGNPLAGSDYWKVVNDYNAAHGLGTKATGTKQAHVPNAKLAFIAALKELSSQAATGEIQSGHADAAAIDQALSGGTIKPGWNHSGDGAIAMALMHATASGSTYYAFPSPIPGEWGVGFMPGGTGGGTYYEATPEHKVTLHLGTGETHEFTQQQVAVIAGQWVKAGEPEKPAEGIPEKLEPGTTYKPPGAPPVTVLPPEPAPQPILDTQAWKQTPEYQAVHDLIVNHPAGLPEHGNKLDTDQQLAAALYIAGKLGQTRYLGPGMDGGWTLTSKVPPGVAGTFGIPGKAYYEVSPDHEIVAYGSDGQGTALPGETVKEIAEKWLTPPPPEKPPEPEIPVMIAGKQVGAVPAGSKIYVNKNHAAEGASKFVNLPDGGWKTFFDHGGTSETPGSNVSHTGQMDAFVQDGTWVPYQPGTVKPEPVKPEPVKPEPEPETQQLKTLLVNGAVKPSTSLEDGKQNKDWLLATALQKAAKKNADAWVAKSPYSSGWSTYAYDPGFTNGEFFHVTADLAVTHHAGGDQIPVVPAYVSKIVQQLVEPDSVKLDVGGKYTTEYKIFKHGFYYKPSKQAKAYLEIKPPGDGSTATTFIYHAPSGDKQVNGSYAAKVLADATEYHAQAKDTPNLAAKKVSWATVAKPGVHSLWSDITHGPSPDHTVGLHVDGSVLLYGPGGNAPLSVNEHGSPADALIEGGAILDQFGTSVVKPGVPVSKYHIFGSEAKTPEQLQSALTQMEQHYGDKLDITTILKDFLPGIGSATPVHTAAMAFFNAKLAAVDWTGQRDSFMGLLRDLLQVPAQPPGTEAAAAEVKFLKGLPPGITDAKDVFDWTDKGYAAPFSGSWKAGYQSLAYATSPEVAAKIKEVGAQFGGGKVVGTHPTSLSKDQKLAWVKAWQAGDMATVFSLDASGGKVSPVHPGAPDNAATHHVTWAPWDESQVPAGQVIEGAWSPEGVLPPKAEVDNYLIKAGLQNAAFLTTTERRVWMQAHRGNDQLSVDTLSKQAAEAFASGAQPQTEPPKWTADLGPATAYGAFLDEKTPAQQWPANALTAFMADHKDAVLPFAQQYAVQQGFTSPEDVLKPGYAGTTSAMKNVLQAYLDDLAAKQAAEKLKPKYTLAVEPGTAEDQFGRQYQWITGTKAQIARRSAVAALARAWGFRTPQVTSVTLEDGTAGAVAPLLAHEGTLAHLPAGIAGLTDRELGDIAREHVIDYALANPGSTPGSYLRVSDGSVVGADKSGALSDLGWQGADPAAMNAQATQPVSLIFSAIADGSLSQEQAGAAYIAAIRAARRMTALTDSRLQQALAGSGLDEHSVAQLTARKNALPDQIQALWDGAFAAKGWTPPEVPVARLSRGLRSGFSEPEFMDHVAAAKSFGVPAFFNEPGLVNGNVLVWTEFGSKGNRLVRGEAAVRKLAMDKVTGWVKAHSGDSASMVPKSDAEFHDAIQNAAMMIDKHNVVMKNYDYTGPVTSAAMAAFASAKAQLTHQLADAQHALAAGPASAAYAAVAKDYGDPASVVSMAQHYLAQVETAEQAKAAGVGTPLSPDQFPPWKAAEQTVLGGGVKITYKKASRQLGTSGEDVTENTWSLGKDDGELHLAAGKLASYPGYVWQVELPTGEVIEINDAGETQTPKAHTGMIRFTSVTSDGSASLERVRAFLQHAGLGMEEAAQPDMENLYWRMMAWVLSDRADRKDPKHMQVWDEVAQALHGKDAWQAVGPGKEATHLGDLPGQVIQANMAPEEEAQMWRTAWAHLTSPEQVQQWVDNEGFLPHLSHFDIHAPEVPGGKPDWFRFDVTPEQVASQQLVTEALYDPAKDAPLVARAGGLFSSDARLRALGTHKTGMSWGSDMSHGASGAVFTRQNMQSGTHMSAWISPRVLARTQTYAFPSDKFGEVDARRTHAFFDFAQASAMSQGGNEALILDAISLLDDIEVLKAYSESQRQQIIADLKGAGITEIRGLPVEDRIVTASGVTAAIKKAIAAMQAAGWFAQPENPFVPPPSALSGAPAAEKKFVAETVKKEKMADAAAQAAQVAAKLEELAKGQEVPFSHAF